MTYLLLLLHHHIATQVSHNNNLSRTINCIIIPFSFLSLSHLLFLFVVFPYTINSGPWRNSIRLEITTFQQRERKQRKHIQKNQLNLSSFYFSITSPTQFTTFCIIISNVWLVVWCLSVFRISFWVIISRKWKAILMHHVIFLCNPYSLCFYYISDQMQNFGIWVVVTFGIETRESGHTYKAANVLKTK